MALKLVFARVSCLALGQLFTINLIKQKIRYFLL